MHPLLPVFVGTTIGLVGYELAVTLAQRRFAAAVIAGDIQAAENAAAVLRLNDTTIGLLAAAGFAAALVISQAGR